MHRLLEFIKRIYVVLLFILLEGIAIWQYATSTPYTEAKILSRTTAVGGYFSKKITNIDRFFSLADENDMLTHRVAELEQTLERERERLADYTEASWQMQMQGNDDDLHYIYYPARVASMTISHLRNYIVLDKGGVSLKIKDEEEIFEIADSYMDAVVEGSVKQYWEKF